ncbi:MAG TPA: TetR/AcrR family transcriptional regulator [Candidatus Cloacimonadota bacterium]|nr:TetR/AcrR family transcriptional regulator [Candidatus Cloacimonadota bacterium]HOD55229.1 TetR/AcrR family transcriptional regulator [Candidatus Cloacimonadota bacterium]HPM01913.1 TetR/AcrR family transcriptional regulator [Candidatus Cloacimonadota bacterium]
MDKRTEIIDAAKKAFRQYGVYKTTLDDIGANCNMRKNSLYYYFKNKEDLFREVIKSEFNDLLFIEKDFLNNNLPLKEMLRQYFHLRFRMAQQFLKEYELMKFVNQQVYHQIFHEETEFLIEEESKIVYAIVHDKVTEGTDINSLITIIISINQGLLYKSLFMRHIEPDLESEIDTIIKFLFNGISIKSTEN